MRAARLEAGKTIRRMAILAVSLAAAAVLAGCDSGARTGGGGAGSGEETFKVGYLPLTHSAPLMIADAETRGELSDGTRLELVPFSSWPELTEALNTGAVDGAVTMLELALAASEKGIAQRLVALSHRNGDAIVVAQHVDSLEDLVGLRFAVPHRLSGHNILLELALKREGLTRDDVEWLEMPPPEMPAALARGDIAGYVVAEPFGAKAVTDGTGKELIRSDELWPDWPCCGLVVTEEAAEGRPGAVRALVAAMVEAGESIEADRAAAAERASEYTAYDADLWERSLSLGIRYDDLRPTSEEMLRLRDELSAMGLVSGDVDVNDVLDTGFLPAEE